MMFDLKNLEVQILKQFDGNYNYFNPSHYRGKTICRRQSKIENKLLVSDIIDISTNRIILSHYIDDNYIWSYEDARLINHYEFGVCVCKYFHDIHSELLENFYSYMQKNTSTSIDLKFIIITEEISFIPDNVLNCCEIINVSRPTKTSYVKCIKTKLPVKLNTENITNIKILHIYNEDLMLQYKIICNKIIHNLININDLQYLKFRDILYDIFIYNLDITDCVWYILSTLIEQKYIKREHLSKIMFKTYTFFQYYNNNYRPIYHVENYLLYLAKLIHGF